MKDKIMKIVLMVVIIEVLLLILGSVFAMLGMFNLTTGCVYRYDVSSNSTSTNDSNVGSVSVRADGNYTSTSSQVNGKTVVVYNPATYGSWQRAHVNVAAGQEVDLQVKGKVSLCMSYLPLNNLGSTTNVDSNNKPIAIPRIEDTNSQPITLVFDAQTVGWRNVIEMYENDVAEIILQDNVTIGQNTVPNIFVPGSNISASCPDGQQFYDPVCGRWSLWNGGQSYVSNCIYEWTTGPICGSHCCEEDALGTCWDFFSSSGPCYNSCEVNTVVSSTLPPQYTTSGGLTSGGNLNIPNGSNLQNILGESCVTGCTETVAGCQSNCTLSTMQTQCQSSCANCKTNCASSYNQCFNACAVGDTACQGKCTSIASCESTYCTSSSCSANCATNSQTSCKTNCSNTYSGCGVQCSSNDTHVQACVYATSNGPNGSPVKAFTNTVTPYRFWFSARDAAGLMQRVSGSSTSLTPTSADYSSLATVMGPNAELTPDQYSGRKLYNKQYGGNTTGYLQYRFFGDDTNTASYANHTGGYVFQVKHTKCIRQLGNVISDTYTNRGQILYVVSNLNPNTDKATATSATAIPVPDSKGNSSITTAAAGDIWFKIDNNQSDYKDSFGVYNIVVSYVSNSGTFISSTITPLVNMIRSNLDSAATQIFQNLICYQQDVNSSCQNFFNYVKAMLMLYIMIYGMMFLTGMVKVTHKDLVIRIVKVGLVAGLISGQTFTWFNDYLFNFIIGFTDQIIANFSGFTYISSVNNAGAPFMFLDTIFTKIFLSKTFPVQLFAVMGIGMIGILYFIIIAAAIVIFIIVGMRGIAIYIMAMIATAFLLSIAPIFLTFMLFEKTNYLFENWYKALFRYMMEPVIYMMGLIIMAQIFTLYLDSVLSYSACWKCSLAFYMPFGNLLPLPGMSGLPLFCIYWFGPWGVDGSGASGQPGMDLASMTGLMIVAFVTYGYADLAGQIASKITKAGSNAKSSISMGTQMAKSIGQTALRQVGMDDRTKAELNKAKQKDRASNRQALNASEKQLEKDEKKVGIDYNSTENKLKRGGDSVQQGLSSAKQTAGNVVKGLDNLAQKLGIKDVAATPPNVSDETPAPGSSQSYNALSSNDGKTWTHEDGTPASAAESKQASAGMAQMNKDMANISRNMSQDLSQSGHGSGQSVSIKGDSSDVSVSSGSSASSDSYHSYQGMASTDSGKTWTHSDGKLATAAESKEASTNMEQMNKDMANMSRNMSQDLSQSGHGSGQSVSIKGDSSDVSVSSGSSASSDSYHSYQGMASTDSGKTWTHSDGKLATAAESKEASANMEQMNQDMAKMHHDVGQSMASASRDVKGMPQTEPFGKDVQQSGISTDGKDTSGNTGNDGTPPSDTTKLKK